MKDYYLSFSRIVLIFIVATFIGVESFELYKDNQAINWPTTKGTLFTTYYRTPYEQGQVYTMSGHTPILEPNQKRNLIFSYEVDGLRYESSNTSFGSTFSETFELISSESKDKPMVKVYYNPSNPNDAVLIPGPKIINIGFLVLNILAMGLIIKYIRYDKNS
jgi:hypothetical protein